MKYIIMSLSIIILLVVGYAFEEVFAKEKDDKIVFLSLTMVNESFTLDMVKIRPGTLKERSANNQSLWFKYVMLSHDGDRIGEGSFKDPRLNAKRLEYEDPQIPGKIKKLHIQEDTLRFVLRIPYHPDLAQVDLFKMSTGLKTRTRDEETHEATKIASIQINLEDAK